MHKYFRFVESGTKRQISSKLCMKRSCSCKRRIARLLGAEGNSNSNKHNRVVEQHHSVHNMLDLEAEASAENHTVCYVPQLRIQTEDTVTADQNWKRQDCKTDSDATFR